MRIKLKHICLAIGFTCFASLAQAAGTLTVVVGGGVLGDGQIKALVEPFEKETGNKVVIVKDQLSLAQLKLSEQSHAQSIDVMSVSEANGIVAARNGYLQNIDYGHFDIADLNAIDPRAKKPWGVEHFYFATVLGFDSRKYPTANTHPHGYADVWNTAKYPGIRTLQSGQFGDEGPWEEALLADGVAADHLYPLDVDRVFRSLDRIKPAVRRWWSVGSEAMQLFDGQVALGMIPDGRAFALQDNGKPIQIVYNDAKVNGLFWAIPKSAPHPQLAQQFVEFAMRAKQQAMVAKLTGYAPTNQGAFQHIDPALAKRLISYPANLKNAYFVDADWYAAIGPDGKTNAQRLAERWNQWILK
ncbi:ABC transporter substrate-binding protein [Burkholderia ubonensis]|uniref:ABC transporter substrate-binding protein n=1 Tax=Burkholderia ubonensis TaxID=101571 RepID=UPI002ABE9B17|nr:ABC transporter substrate-binding protein [Burkholderia ubonensis]